MNDTPCCAMAALKVGFTQLGYTQQYAQNPARYEFLLPLYKRMPVEDAVQHLKTADVAGFSTYKVYQFSPVPVPDKRSKLLGTLPA